MTNTKYTARYILACENCRGVHQEVNIGIDDMKQLASAVSADCPECDHFHPGGNHMSGVLFGVTNNTTGNFYPFKSLKRDKNGKLHLPDEETH